MDNSRTFPQFDPAFIQEEAAERNDYGAYFADERITELEQAIADGLILVEATPQMLQIDIDSDAAFIEFNRAWRRIQHAVPIVRAPIVRPSKSGLPHRHITILLCKDYPIFERIALQCILHSDTKREAANWLRATYCCQMPIVFFETAESIKAPIIEDNWLEEALAAL